MHDPTSYAELYDRHDEYVERRDPSSFMARQIELEVEKFKIPNLVAVIPSSYAYTSVIEIGCATGELIAGFPPCSGTSEGTVTRTGFDIAPLNVEAARARFPDVTFLAEDFRASMVRADVVILSDVLEHVPDDVAFLRAASALGKLVLVNLPLETNWLNRNRNYGVSDSSGHLRAYSNADGLELATGAGLRVLEMRQIWSHETDYDKQRRSLRREATGASYAGTPPVRFVKALVHTLARGPKRFGRWLYPSNLFFSAERVGD